MVDATDLKSVDCKVVWVQVPSLPLKTKKQTAVLCTTVCFLVLTYHAPIIFCIVGSLIPDTLLITSSID